MKRRTFLAAAGSAAIAAMLSSCGGQVSRPRRGVIVIAADGMDPGLVARFGAEGLMPRMSALAASGGMTRLATTLPPQSPVAWSSFITGLDPSGHGIFDFVHRDPATRAPFLSTSVIEPSTDPVRVGRWSIPLRGAAPRLLRKGEPFWKDMPGMGIPVTLMNLPVDFPPLSANGAQVLCGLGTPDITGSQGSFTYFTDDPLQLTDETSGGVTLAVRDGGSGRYDCLVEGPRNTFLEGAPPSLAALTVSVDLSARGALLEVSGQKVVIGEGEWSPWVRIVFEMIPGVVKVSSTGRFFLRRVEPSLELYLTPLNIDPVDPAMQISSPPWLSRDLAMRLGLFHTKGFPEDTKALSRGVLSDLEYMASAEAILEEQERLFRYQLGRFRGGLLFSYFTSLDLNMHMFYRSMDPLNPLYASVQAGASAFVPWLYSRIDSLVGEAIDAAGRDAAVVVMSDHGFAPFRRGFNLNSWLGANGWLAAPDRARPGAEMFEGVDWSSTAAYGLGINSLYLNLRGREEAGAVDPAGASSMLSRLKSELESLVDPVTGMKVIRTVHILADECAGGLPEYAPDAVVGYAPGFRSSWETALGGIPEGIVVDNADRWSGDHCVDPPAVPGVLAANVPVAGGASITDIGASIADLLDSSTPSPGRPVLG
jgi:predicted AlkP superfamily phosphohydrolase/phosphomutase